MKTLLIIASFFVILAVSTSASAYTINPGDIDVGGLDTVAYQTILANSGGSAVNEANELSWIQSVLGADYSLGDKYAGGSLAPTLVNGETDIFAHELATSPEYFLIKIGGGHWGGDTHFLYQNLENTAYGVFDLSDFQEGCTAVPHIPGTPGTTCNIDFERVSHITPTGTTSVPEPSSIALVGLGLIGMGVAARHRKQS